MKFLKLEHNTPTKKLILNLNYSICETNELYTFQNKEYFKKLCEDGCPNFGKKWSCPPYSPNFKEYSKNYKYCLVSLIYCNLNQLNYTKTEYMKIKASNSILKSKMDKFMRYLESENSGLLISNGSCRLCKPCNCKLSLSCKKPNLKRYSMESLGLNVSDISKYLFNHELQWYKNKKSPSYSSVLSCLLLNDTNNINKSIECYFKKN